MAPFLRNGAIFIFVPPVSEGEEPALRNQIKWLWNHMDAPYRRRHIIAGNRVVKAFAREDYEYIQDQLRHLPFECTKFIIAQRISSMRDADLILDEATSSIDTQTEKLLQEGIQEMLRGRTSIIVAHRLSTIKNCDRILYISDKGIAEMGTHDELMEKKGLYYQLYTAQVREDAA